MTPFVACFGAVIGGRYRGGVDDGSAARLRHLRCTSVNRWALTGPPVHHPMLVGALGSLIAAIPLLSP